jgi:hypothetical protein
MYGELLKTIDLVTTTKVYNDKRLQLQGQTAGLISAVKIQLQQNADCLRGLQKFAPQIFKMICKLLW